MSCTLPIGRSWNSRSRTANDDAALMGRCARTSVVWLAPVCTGVVGAAGAGAGVGAVGAVGAAGATGGR